MRITAKYGSRGLITDSMVTPPILQPVNRMVPTGGVMVPTQRFMHRTMPN